MCKRLCTLATAIVVLGSIGTTSADLVGYWSFDEGQGEIARDGSGYGNDGTIYNATWVAGQLGSALNFNGADQAYVDIPPESWDPIETQATCAVWMYVDSATSQSPFTFAAFQDPPNNETRVFSTHVVWNNGNIYFDTAYDGVGSPTYDRISKAITTEEYADAWVHWAFIKNADTGEQKIYINGELWHSGTGMTKLMTGVTKFTLGAKPSLMNWWTGMMDDFQLYNHELTEAEIQQAMLGVSQELATSPTPADQAVDVPRDVALGWEAGEFAATHDVYFGTVFEDVNDASRADDMGVLLSQSQTATTYDPEGVYEYGQTYYWRIDEVNGAPDNTIFKGDIWSFTVEPLAYPIANVTATSNVESLPGVGPENTVNGSGLNENDEHSTAGADMWQVAPAAGDTLYIEFEFDGVYKLHEMLVWNYNVQFELMLGFGLKDVTIEYSENAEDWAVLGDVTFNQGTASPDYTANTTVDFAGVAAKYVRVTVNSGYGMLGQYGLSEVRFLYVPVQAREPQPEDGAADVGASGTLSWRAGREAVSHEVYLSTDPNALELIDTTSETTVDPGALDLAATYYWQINEVNEAEAISTWEGAIWSFSTEAYVVVEDFESYTDD